MVNHKVSNNKTPTQVYGILHDICTLYVILFHMWACSISCPVLVLKLPSVQVIKQGLLYTGSSIQSYYYNWENCMHCIFILLLSNLNLQHNEMLHK